MTHRLLARLPDDLIAVVPLAVVVAILVAAHDGANSVVVAGVGAVSVVVAVLVVAVAAAGGAVINRVQGRDGSVRDQPIRSSDTPSVGNVPSVSPDGNGRRLLEACASVDGLVDYLLARAVDKLPAAKRDRYTEEWQDHRQRRSGWRLIWWALCVRATARRTAAALGPAQLPRDS